MAEQPFISIDSRRVGASHPCLVIAEIAQAHDGSLGAAHAYIDAVATTGADAIKFQTHIADAESSPQEAFRVQTFPQDASRYAYWKRMEFSAEQWTGLAAHAREKGLIFLSTPFSIQAFVLLQSLQVPAWKIGSGEVNNLPMLDLIARTQKPVLLSSGLSSWTELDAAVERVRAAGAPVGLFQCSSSYPCPAEELGLNVMAEMRERFACPVGLSDHSGTIYAGLAAVAQGASLLELHTVFSRDCYGPDVSASITIEELKQLVQGVRFIQTALRHPVAKDTAAAARTDLKIMFGKSLWAARDLAAGHILCADDVELRKPAIGIPARDMQLFIGRSLKQAISQGEFLQENDFE